ncbi:MAG: hypothetical protein NZ739_02480 [Verrucomicrobiae bacterium]|nr:hypothetical protein [Verrucomicrobiae bacterium]MCX7723585.1 hypothetical protein [Verrucomicrobiae bacterium]MDW7980589.1 hypothetical protein [Verrucomicrobiales bacterium]
MKGIAVAGEYLYVADGPWGLQILRMGAPPPVWSAPALATNGFEANLTVNALGTYRIEWSEDLRTWTPLRTLTNISGTVRVVDPAALNTPKRFYRAVLE